MIELEIEPYEDMEDKELCAHCGDFYTDEKFCSPGCATAFFND